MRTHFTVLVIGSLLFLALFAAKTWTVPQSTAVFIIADALQLLGAYVVFAVLVLGHAICHAGKPREEPPAGPD